MTMHVSPSIIDIPDIMARRHLTPGAASTETREEWIENHYLGAFPSREVCAAQLADDYGVLGDDALDPAEDYDLAALTTQLFDVELFDVREGDTFHVFSRH